MNMWWLFLIVPLSWGSYRFLRACEASCPTDWGSRGMNRLVGLTVIFCRVVHRFRPQPLPLPDTGAVLVAANHMSGLDPLLLIAASPRPLRFLIAREQYQRFGLNWIFRHAGCIPVDRQGKPERALREALRALAMGDVIAVFPHGTIHLDRDPPRKLKGGVVRLAHKSGAVICPVRLDDVDGAGHTVRAVLIPSKARLKALPLLDCHDLEHDECLLQLAKLIETPQPENPNHESV